MTYNKYFILVILLLIIIPYIALSIVVSNNKILEDKLSIAVSNEKAYMLENDTLKNQNREFQLTIESLEHSNDSIVSKMKKVTKELKIKNKDIKQLQYLLSEAQKKDTIVFRDTIFKDYSIDIDTTLGDAWYNIKLGLKYPNIVTTEPSFTSEKYIILNYKTETVDPPKKCFIARWFQKKQKVVEVEIVEKNPYIEEKKSKFIEIIK